MENSSTVRIDLQRLQMLNDRLCQTLEALNQVRMSAHSFAPAMGAYGPQNSFWGAPAYPMHNAFHMGAPGYHSYPGYGVAPSYNMIPGYNAFSNYSSIPSWNHGFAGPQAYASYPMNSGYPVNGMDRTRTAPFAQTALW